MHYMTVFKHTAPQGPGEPSKIWGGQEISARAVTYPQKKEELGSLSSLVMRMS